MSLVKISILLKERRSSHRLTAAGTSPSNVLSTGKRHFSCFIALRCLAKILTSECIIYQLARKTAGSWSTL